MLTALHRPTKDVITPVPSARDLQAKIVSIAHLLICEGSKMINVFAFPGFSITVKSFAKVIHYLYLQFTYLYKLLKTKT
jgi:hypothetical protein